ncbi:MAG: hypothetical protein ACTSU7_09810 [Candidatus Heimdallarchaeaceae archaeon]
MMQLSEKELTQMAILKSQGNSKRENSKEINEARDVRDVRDNSQVPKSSNQSQPTESKVKSKVSEDSEDSKDSKTKDDLAVIKKEYPFEVVLGKDKIVHFKAWTGRTKKEFNKLIEDTNDVEELNIDRTMKILIRDYIFENDIYISDIEQQYLLLRFRDESLSDECSFTSLCPECNTPKEIKAKTKDVYRFFPGSYPKEDSDLGVTYVDIKKNSDFTEMVSKIISSKNYDEITTGTDIEIAMHIKKDQKTPIEILEMIDNTNLKNLARMMENLRSAAPSIEMYAIEKCSNRDCKMYDKDVKYYTDDIPDVFGELVG